MAKVLVFTPDLLFGSALLGALSAAGHSVVMCPGLEALEAEASGAGLVIADLTDAAATRTEELAGLRAGGPLEGVPVLGYHSHVDPASRDTALEGGVERVVPRSRMHREPAALVEAMLASDRA